MADIKTAMEKGKEQRKFIHKELDEAFKRFQKEFPGSNKKTFAYYVFNDIPWDF